LATFIKKPKNARKPEAVGYKVSGKQRERSFTTRKEADAYKAKYEYESRQQIFTDPNAGGSFTEAAEAYIDRLDCAANTTRGYWSRLYKHIAPPMGDGKLAAVAMDRDGVRDLIALTPPGVRGSHGSEALGFRMNGKILRITEPGRARRIRTAEGAP
jgi:hypothetical protein